MSNLKTFLILSLIMPAAAQAAKAGDEGFKRNGFELFGGATFNNSETDASFGLSYERRVTEKFGIGGLAGAMGLLLAYVGDKLDLYSALAEISPASSQELADNTGMNERYIREWLSANAAGGTSRMIPPQASSWAIRTVHPHARGEHSSVPG